MKRAVAQRFDADTLKLSGDSVMLAEQVRYTAGIAEADFSVSETGMLVCRSGGQHPHQLVWANRRGQQIGVAAPPGQYNSHRLSPDEKQFSFFAMIPEAA